MDYTKAAQFTKFSVPVKWSGEFDGTKMQEKITYRDGTELEINLCLSENSEVTNNLENIYEQIQHHEYEDEEEIDECYVVVEENETSFLVHKDVLDVYMELMNKE